MYIYPDNLRAKAKLWLWELRDVAVIGIGGLLSVLALAQGFGVLLLILTVLYAFLSIRMAGDQDIKRLLAVYYQQDVTTEFFESFDGERSANG